MDTKAQHIDGRGIETRLDSSTDLILILLEVGGSEFKAILSYIKTLRPALDTELKEEGDFSMVKLLPIYKTSG